MTDQDGTPDRTEGAHAGWEPSREILSAVLDLIDEIVLGVDESGVIRYVSPAARHFGYRPGELVGHNVLDFLHPDEHEHLMARLDRWVGREGTGFGPTVRVRDGHGVWTDVSLQAITGAAAEPFALLAVISAGNPSERIGTSSDFQARLARLASSFVHLPAHRIDDGMRAAMAEMGALDGVDRVCLVILDDEKELLVNTHEWTSPGVASMREQFGVVPATDSPLLRAMRRFENVYITDMDALDPAWAGARSFWRRRGVVSVAGVPLADEGRFVGFVGFEAVHDQHPWGDSHRAMLQAGAGILAQALARQRAEAELAHQAHHDSLTGLGNRWYFLERLEAVVTALDRNEVPFDDGRPDERPPSGVGVAVALFDLDRFKVVNDSLGHAAGDKLLTEVAERLDRARRPGDAIARLGGDELVLLFRDVHGVDDAIARVRELRDSLRTAIDLDGHEAFVTTSVGVAFATSGGEAAEDLLRDADAAMYVAKTAGRDRVEVFDDAMRGRVRTRLARESELRRAIIDDELLVHYQPEVGLLDDRIFGAEALVRWQHPTRGLLAASEFVDLAEETGLILDIGPLVLEQTCRQLGSWQQRFPDQNLLLSVNLSARQLGQPDLAAMVVAAIERGGVEPSSLCLEITETTLMADAETSLMVLEKLRGLGVELAIDDFGTGYSSLSYLKRLPVTILKIDRSFVDGLGTDPDDTAIVSAIVSLADSLGLQVVAEGIETEEQRSELIRLGVRTGQGYLLARPMPDTGLTERLVS